MSKPLPHEGDVAPAAVVVGTAGHVDHGKSTLVHSLTGIDPDRWEEEKRRGMTIDLGFAHMDLPSGIRVAFVDVPGHERLIRNMLAGAAGFDAVMLVVAADEGVMPQTREHMDILRFLRVSRGLVALTKRDLVDDEWLELVVEDLREFLRGSFLQDAPLVPVSAKTGEGIPDLVQALEHVVAGGSRRSGEGPVRLPVDRSFHVAGFGTVVTGTLWSGRIRLEESLELLPAGRAVRVRGLQCQGRAVREARAGQRVAVNLQGVATDEVDRGDVLASPGCFSPAASLDVRLQLLPATPPLRHGERIRVYVGTAEVMGRVFLLDRDGLGPGEYGLAQLRLETPLVAAFRDPFVIRRYSPLLTWGGGEVLRVNPPRHRRKDVSVLSVLRRLESGDPREAMLVALEARSTEGAATADLVRDTGLPAVAMEQALEGAQADGLVQTIQDRWFHRAALERAATTVLTVLEAYHRDRPWRRGMPHGEWLALLRRQAGEAAELVGQLVADRVASEGGFVRLCGHEVRLTREQMQAIEEVRAWLRRAPLEGPSRFEVRQALGEGAEVAVQWLLDHGEVLELRELLYWRPAVEEATRRVVEALREQGSLTVAAARDVLGTSRKYALPLLEHLDTIGVTRRQGDLRVAGPALTHGAGEGEGAWWPSRSSKPVLP